MKALIIGASLSGKTTLVRHLRLASKRLVSEMDEELTKLNGGKYPTDLEYKHNVLARRIIQNVLGEDNIVFFTNTDYFTADDLKKARGMGFKIIQLSVDLDQLQQRNENRVKNDGYEDLSKWLGGMTRYQKEMKQKNLVDQVVDADLPTDKVVNELLKALTV